MTPLSWRRPFPSLIRPARFTDTRLAAGIVAAIVAVCLLAVGARMARAQEDDEATRYYCTHNHSCAIWPGKNDCGCGYSNVSDLPLQSPDIVMQPGDRLNIQCSGSFINFGSKIHTATVECVR
jgi:hypothetical protein